MSQTTLFRPRTTLRTEELFNEDDVTFREQLQLSEKQRFNARQLFTSEWKPAFIGVFPTTMVVHRELAEKKMDIRCCVFITCPGADRIAVFAAPIFCCRKPVNRAALCPPRNSYVNIAKCDLKVIESTDAAPHPPIGADRRFCVECRQREEAVEGGLFSLPCGHVACRPCWLKHCKWALAYEISPIPCMNGHCDETLTISRAATLFSDLTIELIIECAWKHKLRQPDNLQCADCNHWMERPKLDRKVLAAGCACVCYTCVRCGQRDHTPLRCKDAAVWNEIRAKGSENEQAAEAENVWGLSREEFDECLVPSREVAGEKYMKNIRFMRTNDRINGKMIEKDMPMVARMLELRRVQQAARLKDMPRNTDPVHSEMDADERWAHLEDHFFIGIDTVGETKSKAMYLRRCKDHVIYYYNF